MSWKKIIRKDEYDYRGKLIDEYYDEPIGEAAGETFQDVVKELYGMIEDVNVSKEFIDRATVLAQKLMDNLQYMEEILRDEEQG